MSRQVLIDLRLGSGSVRELNYLPVQVVSEFTLFPEQSIANRGTPGLALHRSAIRDTLRNEIVGFASLMISYRLGHWFLETLICLVAYLVKNRLSNQTAITFN